MKTLVLSVALALPTTLAAQGSPEVDMVKGIFTSLQPVSIAENIEFCGYVGFDDAGALAFSEPTRGNEGSCVADEPDNLNVITASYHTHGGHSLDYFNEVPSGDDMEGDADEGIDGYVATPGGRLWYIDSSDMIASQLCGIGCLPADPLFRTGENGLIKQSYTYDDLIIKLEE